MRFVVYLEFTDLRVQVTPKIVMLYHDFFSEVTKTF